ncbi:hypothetical protein V1J52_03900 [Streptomyces sp. TRM 70351]|uniref:hypothetical protein n=1 Tax=Streptomyces sp. TRM 70351 TaxID=3116552 RepID=UPI002E7B28F6|nr:hypothetical protein [Streptomyces sp. TRM 70351]MEE1927332.1 hypothetical protein [Streptomyces sp. TRM 70351]
MEFTFTESKKDPERDCFIYTAHDDLDLLGIAALRRRVPRDLFGRPAPVPDGGRGGTDPFAPHTTHLAVMVDGEIVAGAELVAYSPLGLPLRSWKAASAVLTGHHRLVQCRRPLTLTAHARAARPEMPFGAVGGLVKGCLQWAVLHDVRYVVAEVADEAAAAALGQLGFEPVPGLPPSPGAQAVQLAVSQLVSRSFRSTSAFYRYLLEYDEGVLVQQRVAIPA